VEPENKPNVRIVIDIRGGPATPAQLAVWKRFWTKLIADANHDLVGSQTNNIPKEINNEK